MDLTAVLHINLDYIDNGLHINHIFFYAVHLSIIKTNTLTYGNMLSFYRLIEYQEEEKLYHI